MYVSGTLKKKTVNFYKPSIINFNEEGLELIDAHLGYDGNLSMLPWNKSLEEKLTKRQEELISKGKEKTIYRSSLKFNKAKSYINKILQKITNTSRKYSYALFECFYEIVMTSKTKEELITRITEFEDFINYLETNEVNQIDLDMLISLFLRKKSYDLESLKRAKEESFHIIEEDLPSTSLEEITYLGEFISPNRVPIIASTIYEEIEYSKLVLPTYFIISDEQTATKFLRLCRTPDLDEEKVKKNARILSIPNNLENLIR